MGIRQSRARRILLIIAGVGVMALAVLHLSYPLPYVYTVMTDQGPDYDDIEQFPASAIRPSDSPRASVVALDPAVAEAFELHPDVERLDQLIDATGTTAFLVQKRGRLLLERYGRGHDQHSFQNTFSVTKSFVSALVGLAVRDGVLDLQAPITSTLPELAGRDPRFSEITIEHLLDMRSGIRYSRKIGFPIINQHDPLIYYHPDLASVVLERTEVASPPGEFQYNNFNPPLLGLALRRATGQSPSAYLENNLWQPMGASGAAGWTTDAQGFERMESGFHATARDLVRFGELYLAHGLAGERAVVPEGWVSQTTDFAKPVELETYNGRSWGYRLGWWIVPRPTGPSDFCAIGHFGQFIYVSPQYEVVFVRNGLGLGEWSDRDWTELFYSAAEQIGDEASPGPPPSER